MLLRRGGSNSRPSGYEPDELPLLYFAMWVANVSSLYHTIQNCFSFFTFYYFHRMKYIALALLLTSMVSCSSSSHTRQDELYSRHLQRKVQLTIVNNNLKGPKDQWNLLLLNDGNEMEKLDVSKVIDSLQQKGSIGPLIVVGIHTGDRMQEYGISNKPDFEGRGNKADNYSSFVGKELIPFILKKSEVRSFKTVAMAGCSLGGLSAFDVAWNNSAKIDKAGIFSGSFWWRDKDATDSSYDNDKNRITLAKIKASRKQPGQQFWFYSGWKEETSDRDKDGITDAVDDTRDVVQALKTYRKFPAQDIVLVENKDGQHDWPSWKEYFPLFLAWAFPANQ